MSEESNQSRILRRKRVQRLKKAIVLAAALAIVSPMICCIVLFGKVKRLDQTLQSVDDELRQISRLLEQQADARQVDQVTVSGSIVTDELPLDNRSTEETTGVIERSRPAHQIYLTFDDGPSIYTDDILDILNQYGVKATFFVVGKEDAYSQEMLKRIVEEGHSLGMHSYSHKYSELYASEESFREDFQKLQDYLYEITGVRSTIYRFPGGSSNTVSRTPMEQLFSYLEEQGVTYYDWNVSAGDAGSRRLGVREILNNATEHVENQSTSIILMHDAADKPTTVEALPMIIEKLLELEDVEILPITEETEAIQHKSPESGSSESKEGMEG